MPDFARLLEGPLRGWARIAAIGILPALLLAGVAWYMVFRVEVPAGHIAVLVKKTGKELPMGEEIAPSEEYKGLQRKVLSEGRYFLNPWHWAWEVVPQIEIPEGNLGVRVRLHGDDLGYGEIIASTEQHKGIVPAVLRPGRYPINGWVIGSPRRELDNYAEYVEVREPIQVPAGYKGVVTNLSARMPEQSNVLLVGEGERGVQLRTLDEGTYYLNPYMVRVDLVDCRSQRYNLSEEGEMGFPSRDGFWVTLDGIIEFRVQPAKAAEIFVRYNDGSNDEGTDARIDDEIIKKVILPNARSFCRLRGSDHSGREFIEGETRIKFQEDFQKELEKTCEEQGIEIIHALITRINPPSQIMEPVSARRIAMEQANQYVREIEQQESEQQLAMQQEMVARKQRLVQAEQAVVKVTTEASQKQEVAVIEAEQKLAVARVELQAAEDMAAAVLSRGQGEAEVILFKNEAEAAGWQRAVTAFGGDGAEYARWVMYKKMAPAFRQMMVNTADSPIMDIFRQYSEAPKPTATPPTSTVTAPSMVVVPSDDQATSQADGQ